MPSVGFSELALLFIIGLLILGPERLPRVASQLGRWIGRARRTANQLRYQLEREVTLADLDRPKKPEPPRPAVRPEAAPAASAAPTASAAVGSPGATASDAQVADESAARAAEPAALPESGATDNNETIRKS